MKRHELTKLMAAMLTVMSIIVVLTGCGSKKSNPLGTDPELLVGTWDLVDITSKFDGHTMHIPKSEIEADPLTYSFDDDGSGVTYYQGDEYDFDWDADGSTLIFYDNYYEFEYTFGVNATTLHLSFYEEEYFITHIFSRR